MSEHVVASGDAAGLKTVIETTAVAGDKVIVPRGAYDFSGIGKVTVNKELEIEGEGRLSTMSWGAAASHGFELAGNVLLENVKIRRLAFTATFGSSNPLDGISYLNDGGGGHLLRHLVVEECLFSGWRNGLQLVGTTPNGLGQLVSVRGCEVVSSRVRGVRAEQLTLVHLDDCQVTSAGQNGVYFNECQGVKLTGNRVAGNNTLNGTTELGDAQVALAGCDAFAIFAHICDAMPSAGSATKKAIVISDCKGGETGGITIAPAAFFSDNYGVRLINGCTGIRMGAMGFTNILVTNSLTFDPTCAPALLHAWTVSQHAVPRA